MVEHALVDGRTQTELIIDAVLDKHPVEARRKGALNLYKYLSKHKGAALPELYVFDRELSFLYNLANSKDEETVQYLAACLFVSFKQDSNWSLLKETNALSCIKTLLEMPGTESRAHAVTTVALVSEGPERHASIVDAGLVDPLVTLLSKSRSDRVLGQISLILSNLAAVDPNNRRMVAQSNAISGLSRVISVRLKDHAILQRVTHALTNIAVCPEAHDVLVTEDNMNTLLMCLENVQFDDIKRVIVGVLEILSTGSLPVRRKLADLGCLEAVSAFAFHEEVTVVMSVVSFIVNLAVEDDAARKIVKGKEFGILLRLAEHQNSGVRLNAAIAFGNLGSHASCITSLCTEGVLDCLIEMMNRQSDVRLNQEAIHSLMNIVVRARKQPDLMLLALNKENFLTYLFETIANPANAQPLKILGMKAALALASYPPTRDLMCTMEPVKLSNRKHALSAIDLLVTSLEAQNRQERCLALQIIAMLTVSGSDSAIIDRIAEKPTIKVIMAMAKTEPDYLRNILSIAASMARFEPLTEILLENRVVELLVDMLNGKVPVEPSGFLEGVEEEAAELGPADTIETKRFACSALHSLAINPDSHADIVTAKAHEAVNLTCIKHFEDLDIVLASILFYTALAKSEDPRAVLNANRDFMSMLDSVAQSNLLPEEHTRLTRVLAGKSAIPGIDEDEELDIVERKKRSEATDTSAIQRDLPVVLKVFGPEDLPQTLIGTLRGSMTDQKKSDTSAEGESTGTPEARSRLNVKMDEVTLQARIGVGSFGEVFDGLYRGERVAIKRIWQKKMSGPGKEEELEYFKQEVEVMQKLAHNSIIAFKGACTTPPDLMVITEFCEKGSIADVIEENLDQIEKQGESAAMPWRQRLALMVDAASAIAHMHSFDPPYLHRDLKPENLLVKRKMNGTMVCKVADFGLARIKDSCQTMTRCGTPCYMAPEVLRGERYGQEADVYSLGVILWEMATLQQPFNDLHPLVAARKVALEGLRPPLPKHCPVPGYLELIQKCFQTRPHDRPSMGYIAKKLTDMQKNF